MVPIVLPPENSPGRHRDAALGNVVRRGLTVDERQPLLAGWWLVSDGLRYPPEPHPET